MSGRVCPVWVGYFLASPIRKLFQNPKKILSPYIKEGMMILDLGCAMGFFSLPMAEMVGPSGLVVCVDIQQKMLDTLSIKADKAGLSDRIQMRLCDEKSLGLAELKGQVDFALASAVVHEVPDTNDFFTQVHEVLKPGCDFLVMEPTGHVSKADFEKTILDAENAGFEVKARPTYSRVRSVLLHKKQE